MEAFALLQLAFLCPIVLLLSVTFTWCMIRIKLLSVPNNRSSHEIPIPTAGGLGIVLATTFGLLFYGLSEIHGKQLKEFYWIILATLIVAAGGLLDDFGKAKSFKAKLGFQIFGTIVVLFSGVSFSQIYIPFWGALDLGLFSYVLTFFWIIGFTNVFNFMDGIDGIAGGTVLITSIFLVFLGILLGLIELVFFSSILGFATAGFLFFNFPKAYIFMGDLGSQFLGFSIAILGVLIAKSDVTGSLWIIIPLLFFHFIFDTVFTLLRRWWSGEIITQAHRSHLYQLLVRLGYTHVAVSGLHLIMSLVLGMVALLIVGWSEDIRIFAFLPCLLVQMVYAKIVLNKKARFKRFG